MYLRDTSNSERCGQPSGESCGEDCEGEVDRYVLEGGKQNYKVLKVVKVNNRAHGSEKGKSRGSD